MHLRFGHGSAYQNILFVDFSLCLVSRCWAAGRLREQSTWSRLEKPSGVSALAADLITAFWTAAGRSNDSSSRVLDMAEEFKAETVIACMNCLKHNKIHTNGPWRVLNTLASTTFLFNCDAKDNGSV